MKRWVLRLFPRAWLDRYGDDFVEHFAADPRRGTKWVDLGRAVMVLRWNQFATSPSGLAVALLMALAASAICDTILAVGMDERIDPSLLSHWWAAPFAAVLALAATSATISTIATLAVRARGRWFAVNLFGVGAGAFLGSALAAASNFDLAGLGAGLGLMAAATALRLAARTPIAPADAHIAVATALVIYLGFQWAHSPIGPLALLVVYVTLLTTRAPVAAMA